MNMFIQIRFAPNSQESGGFDANTSHHHCKEFLSLFNSLPRWLIFYSCF